MRRQKFEEAKAHSEGWASPDEHGAEAALLDILQVGLQDVMVHNSSERYTCTRLQR